MRNQQSSLLDWYPEEEEAGLSRAELIDWVDEFLTEGYSEASTQRRPLLLVKERDVKCDIPYEAIDSEMADDVQFFVFGDRGFLFGIGKAREWKSGSERSLRNLTEALDLENASSSSSNTWLLGGWSFPPPIAIRAKSEKVGETWKPFPYSRWIVPALLLTSTNGRTSNRLILAAYFDPKSKKKKKNQQRRQREYYQKLVDILVTNVRARHHHLPRFVRSTDLPSRKEWVLLARRAVSEISEGALKKVVLSRSKNILFEGDIKCSSVLRRLVESNHGSTTFAIKNGSTIFLGATPEHLLSVKDSEIEVDCLAASAPRDEDAAVDESLGQDLLADEKSRREHGLVVQNVTRTLSSICSEITSSGEPRVKKLATVQHLQTIVRGRLHPGLGTLSAALSIWPTPATGGEPKEQAVRWIRRHEPFERGWYSGVVGCVNTNGDADLFVAIRSGVIRGNRATTFAGSGIVAGSDPDAEFEETNWKMGTMMDALGVKGPDLY